MVFDAGELDKRGAGERGGAVHIVCDGLPAKVCDHTLAGGGQWLRRWRDSGSGEHEGRQLYRCQVRMAVERGASFKRLWRNMGR